MCFQATGSYFVLPHIQQVQLPGSLVRVSPKSCCSKSCGHGRSNIKNQVRWVEERRGSLVSFQVICGPKRHACTQQARSTIKSFPETSQGKQPDRYPPYQSNQEVCNALGHAVVIDPLSHPKSPQQNTNHEPLTNSVKRFHHRILQTRIDISRPLSLS